MDTSNRIKTLTRIKELKSVTSSKVGIKVQIQTRTMSSILSSQVMSSCGIKVITRLTFTFRNTNAMVVIATATLV